MTDKDSNIKKSNFKWIACFVVCFLIGFGYVQKTFSAEGLLIFHLFGVGVLSLLSSIFGFMLAEEMHKEKSGFLFGILIFLICLGGFHFFLYLPNS